MAKKKTQIPKYGTITLKGIQYYRTRITDADGKELSLYAATCEELYEKQLEARKQVEEIIFHRQHPTVAEYGEKWLLMQSAKVSASTLRGYTRDMTNYIIKPLGEMYMEEVTADDIRLALVPLSKKSEGLYNKVNMLLKCIFYAAERNQILEHNPCAGISGKGGKPTKKKEALTDQQVAVLLDTVKGLPPYLFIMLGLYSGLRREEILALQWDCVFLDEDTPYLSLGYMNVETKEMYSKEEVQHEIKPCTRTGTVEQMDANVEAMARDLQEILRISVEQRRLWEAYEGR